MGRSLFSPLACKALFKSAFSFYQRLLQKSKPVLQMPLLLKLVLTDIFVNITAYWMMRNVLLGFEPNQILATSLLFTLFLNIVLVYWTLRPLRALEQTTKIVAEGNLHARVPIPMIADSNVRRISQIFNVLLEKLLADQARVQYLSAQAIGAADAERAHLAGELHDSIAQSLSAVEMMLSASMQDKSLSAPEQTVLRERMQTIHEIITGALKEVRTLAHRVHPSALEHLGLDVALETLMRLTLKPNQIESRLKTRISAATSPLIESVLYRVAQEALGNALKHGKPKQVIVVLIVDHEHVRLTIHDDGLGFDSKQAQKTHNGMGLFVMRERLVLVGGSLSIDSEIGHGTVIHAVAPNHTPAPTAEKTTL